MNEHKAFNIFYNNWTTVRQNCIDNTNKKAYGPPHLNILAQVEISTQFSIRGNIMANDRMWEYNNSINSIWNKL